MIKQALGWAGLALALGLVAWLEFGFILYVLQTYTEK